MLTQVICCYGPSMAVMPADLNSHVLAAMGTLVLRLHLKQAAVSHLRGFMCETLSKM